MIAIPMQEQAPEEQLRQEVAGLADDEILALCYAFKGKNARLRLYIDVLRRRGGQRAQFAACLICFDLARQGDPSFQREFIFLADTIRALAANAGLVAALLGGDDYLTFIWELCQAALAEMDPLEAAEPIAGVGEPSAPLAEIDLLGDADFQDFGVATDDGTLWRRFDDAVEGFLGGVVGLPVYERGAGFRLANSKDVERIETFLARLESLRDAVPPARGFRALVLLFYGTQLRSRGLFGTVNTRKQQVLREGLREFASSGLDVWEIAGVLGPMHAGNDVWERIAEVLLDYLRWQSLNPNKTGAAIDAYDPVAAAASRPRAYT